MHTNEYSFLIVFAHDVINSRLHSGYNIVWTFSALDSYRRVSQLPLLEHVMIVLILLRRNFVSLLGSPTDFVQACQGFCCNTQIQKTFYGFPGPLQYRSIYLVEWNILIMIEECLSLGNTALVQTAVYAATLNNVPKVEISLPVTNEVDFFAVQFSTILGAKIRK